MFHTSKELTLCNHLKVRENTIEAHDCIEEVRLSVGVVVSLVHEVEVNEIYH